MNFVDFGKAHLPFLFYFGSYSFNRSSAMSVIVFSKIQVTYKLSGHLHSFIWILHKQWNVDYLTKNAVSSKQSPRRFPVKTLRCSTPSISNTARLRLQNIFSFDLFCILNPSMLVKLGYKSSQIIINTKSVARLPLVILTLFLVAWRSFDGHLQYDTHHYQYVPWHPLMGE